MKNKLGDENKSENAEGDTNKIETSENESDDNISQTEDNEKIISEEFANTGELTEDEQEFLNLINANRESNGLSSLQIDNEVQNIARLKAEDLVNNNYFAHVSETYGDVQNMLNTYGISYQTAGENIAGNSSLAKAVEAWMASENHKVNILSEEYNYTGVAVVNSDTYGKIFVEIFIQK